MQYLSAQEVLILHARVIEETGGLHGVRDVSLLESACGRPKAGFGGSELYKTLFQKAVALLHSLASNHPFLDGNKRTAAIAAARVLYINGYDLEVSQKSLVAFMINVAIGKLDVVDIAEWLKKHSKKI